MTKQELKEAGLKVTVPRMHILQILEEAQPRHMSAEDIYQCLLAAKVDVGLATVYRVLTQFESAGLVMRHNFEGDYAVYELNQGGRHDHLICVKCGHVEEFVDPVIEQRQKAIAEQAKFQITEYVLNVYGLCSDCQE